MTETKCLEALKIAPSKITMSDSMSEMPQCLPDELKVEGDAVAGYRNYYIIEKRGIANSNEHVIDTLFGYTPNVEMVA